MIKLYLTIAVVTLIGGVVYGGFYVYQDKQKRRPENGERRKTKGGKDQF